MRVFLKWSVVAIPVVAVVAVLGWVELNKLPAEWSYVEDIDMTTGFKSGSITIQATKVKNAGSGSFKVWCRSDDPKFSHTFNISAAKFVSGVRYAFDGAELKSVSVRRDLIDESVDLVVNGAPVVFNFGRPESEDITFISRLSSSERLFVSFDGANVTMLFEVSKIERALRKLENYCW